MVALAGILSRMNRKRVMVVGDLMLDTYTIGKARRISPEAPVAVVHVQKEEHRPGGAGNVVLNLVSLGAEVVVVGRTGEDPYGALLKQILNEEGADIRGIVRQRGFPTPIKNRILADNQQVVRVDHECCIGMPPELEQELMDLLPGLLEGVRIVAISDYGKGFLSKKLLGHIIACSKQQGIPVIADPKGVDFGKYSGTTILKPNLGEAYAAANLSPDFPLEEAAKRIHSSIEAETLMITRSEAGISLFHRSGLRQDFPVKAREVKDVTGAGDTVLATLAYVMANDLPLDTAVRLSNVTAGMAIERFGCARITFSELARRLLQEDANNKIFDGDHLFALQSALQDRPFTLFILNGFQQMNSLLFKSIRQLSHPNKDLLVYIQDLVPNEELVNLLVSLQDVNFVLLHTEDIKNLWQDIYPEKVYLLNQEALAISEVQLGGEWTLLKKICCNLPQGHTGNV